MTTRTSFRPRQVDINRLLPLVRDLADLDTGDSFASRGVTHGHEALDAENEKILTVKQAKKAVAEIPIPIVNSVSTYEEDYRPDFVKQNTYIRAPVRTRPGEEVEYDLDDDDERWLAEFNACRSGGGSAAGSVEGGGRTVLDEDRFELMINKLEFACAEAGERAAGGASSSNHSNHTIYLRRDIAFDELRRATGAKHSVLMAVYDYWKQKRARLNKPLLRKLQAPTSANDKNPYNVFRPREKAHRPQTRRRRENNVQSFEKLKELRLNMEMSKELLEWVMRRERKKRDFVCCQCDLQRLRIKLHHDPKSTHEQTDQDFLGQSKVRTRKFAEQEARAKEAENDRSPASQAIANLFPAKPILESFRSDDQRRKKKRGGQEGRAWMQQVVVPPLPPPPEPAELEMLFTRTFDLADLPFAESLDLPPEVRRNVFRARVGRGGRLILEKKLSATATSAVGEDSPKDPSDSFLASTFRTYPFLPPPEGGGRNETVAAAGENGDGGGADAGNKA